MDERTPIDIAVSQLAELEKLHIGFMKTIASLQTTKVNGGEVSGNGQNFGVTALGVPLNVTHRFVARDQQHLSDVEYSFIARHGESEVAVWRLFLKADNDLYTGFEATEKLCSSGNTSLAKNMIQSLVLALLRSPLFAPTP
jgi:hypothetical protein